MVYGSPGPHGSGARAQNAAHEWHQDQVASLDDAQPLIEMVLHAMAQRGYTPEGRERLRREMEEALRSALQLGQRQDPQRPVRIAYRVGEDYTLVEIEGRERPAQGVPAQGPHAQDLLLGREEAPIGGRSYTWLRCNRRTGGLLICKHLCVP